MRAITLTAILLTPLLAGAETAADLEAVPEPPELPERVQSGEALEPEVTIIQREDELVTEYRVRGRIYMIRVTPKHAPPYLLVDADGDGRLETRLHELGADFLVPQWVLFRW